ncbi:MAG: tyrosine-type recombinase/integrase [Desulfobulbaceae bacterium]|nr:MAG: tyrosine-type recombinase/integrase [Desulfobulbaceae bacterium]
MKDNSPITPQPSRGHLTPIPDSERCLDAQQLYELEQSFRQWAKSSNRTDIENSRKRILLIFLIIRYTGARLNETLSLNLAKDLDDKTSEIRFCRKHGGTDAGCREVRIPEAISSDIRTISSELRSVWSEEVMLRVDPAHIRKNFYKRAEAIGIQSSLGAPEAIRKSRAVELMQNSMPLQVVQKILGQSTPNLTASFVEFSESEISQVAQYFADRENNRKTSARNAFYGKISSIQKGTVQTSVEVITPSGVIVTSIITTNSLTRIGLKRGMLVTAEVKAPLIQLCKNQNAPKCSAENVFPGTVCEITKNRTTSEVVARLSDGTELCAIISEKNRYTMNITEGDALWMFFNGFSVVLHID